MSVRKRSWVTTKGEQREAWLVDYVDQHGGRHIETFERKRDADARHSVVNVGVRQGTHTPTSASITVAEAAEDWIAKAIANKRERSTTDQYRQHINHHLKPRLGDEKLARLTTPRIETFCDELLTSLSRALAKKVLASLKMLLNEARRRGNVAQNVAHGVSIAIPKRSKKKLVAGTHFPTLDEAKRIIDVSGKHRSLLLVAIFAGLRSSELRGLRWQDVNLKTGEIKIQQRVDRYNVIGDPKSEAGQRNIPLGPLVLNALREWKLVCPRGDYDLVFPNGVGRIESHTNLVKRVWCPIQIAAGVVKHKDKAKYTGLHTLRHFFASWCINRQADGGLGLPPKSVQERLGHASIAQTLDTYGHLFPRGDDAGELARAEGRLLLA
jgi:integrase